MRSVKNEFPNPVLAIGRDDYIDSCRFYTEISEEKIKVDTQNIVIPIKYVLECKGLEELVAEGKAAVIVLVKSSAASYSNLIKLSTDRKEQEILIPKFKVVKKIEVECSVVAACNIKNFSCKDEFNRIYFGDSTFEIRKGDILAMEAGRTIFLDDTELEGPISSIFLICLGEERQASDVEVYFEGEKIEIHLKEELYRLYNEFKDEGSGALRRYVTGIIVYPALIKAVNFVIAEYRNEDSDNENESFEERRWFRAIEKKIKEKGIDLENSDIDEVSLANDLLGNIAFDSLKCLKDYLDNELNSGETQMIGGID